MLNLFSAFRHNPHPPHTRLSTAPQYAAADYEGSPFEVISPRQIGHIIHQAIAARLPVTLSNPHLGDGMTSRLLGIDQPGGEFFIRQAINDSDHASLLRHDRLNMLLRQTEATVLLSLAQLRRSRFNGHDCYAAPLPTWAVSSQMRSWQRIHLPPATSMALRHTFQDKDYIDARITDISEGGMSIVLPHLPLRGFRFGEQWRNANLSFRDMEIARVVVEIRHVRCGLGSQQIGLAIRDASEVQMQKLRRLLLRLQSLNHKD